MRAFGATLLRVILGITFVSHGYLGYFDLTPEGTADFITVMEVPLGRRSEERRVGKECRL